MTLEELKEQLQENIVTVLDDYQGYEIDSLMIDKICQIVVDTFNNAFFAPAPISLDSTPQN
jgi:hypothetical protein